MNEIPVKMSHMLMGTKKQERHYPKCTISFHKMKLIRRMSSLNELNQAKNSKVCIPTACVHVSYSLLDTKSVQTVK